MKTYPTINLAIPQVLLPKPGINSGKWAVIACDQFTSEPEYWQAVSDFVGDAPSTFKLIFPEVYLEQGDEEQRISSIRQHMEQYLNDQLLEEKEGMIYLERQVGQQIRKGLVICLDLEAYNFNKGSTSPIRATEGTIVERIPPRVKIREGAPMELPHIMVLIDDTDNSVIGPLTKNTEQMEKVYDFDLMRDSGHLTGYRVTDPQLVDGVVNGLQALADPANAAQKYGLSPDTPVLLYAMGDGNHSLATAKAIWEKTKEAAEDPAAVMDSPLRYALVELVNLHDTSLVFEPIHRVLFDLAEGRDLVEEMKAAFPGKCQAKKVADLEEMKSVVDTQSPEIHKIGFVNSDGFGVIEVTGSGSNLPVGTLQQVLDKFMKEGGAKQIDYVHGTSPVVQLGQKPNNLGLYLPVMQKEELFKSVILDGALPRKTFSMGEAWEKRFYMEARRLG